MGIGNGSGGVWNWVLSDSVAPCAAVAFGAFLTVMALALVGVSLSWPALLRYVFFREELGPWHLAAFGAALLTFGWRRYQDLFGVIAWLLLTTVALGLYGLVIALGAREDIFSFRHSILSWVTFLDHALWRTGYVSGWNFIAAALAIYLICFAMAPGGKSASPAAILAGVWRRLTGRGPSESGPASHPLA